MTLEGRRLNRRIFLKGALAAGAGAVLAPTLGGLSALGTTGRAYAAPGDGGYGPLVPTADQRDGAMRIALPRGFKYRSFGVAGTPMSDGNLTPLAHDGMAVFNIDGKFRLVRNHEDRGAPNAGSVKGPNATKYDLTAGGGTTTLVIDPDTRLLLQDFISLNGTIVNCAGGITPWDSWITCEETNAGVPQGWAKQHGYAFDVPAAANSTVPAIHLPLLGRFSHEAIAVDPKSGIVYETEDNGNNSGFYRFVSKQKGVLTDGKLQMLAIEGQPEYDTVTGQVVGDKLPVVWVDIANPDPPGQASTAVFSQGLAAGGARFARLEGCWEADGSIYFASTSGGEAGVGQVWEYSAQGANKGRLTLIFESPGPGVLDAPDNLAVSPQGGLILCEDGDEDQYLRGITRKGDIFDFALNLDNIAGDDTEWAGATFATSRPGLPNWGDSDDDDIVRGRRVTLFVNRQGTTSGANPPPSNQGMTFAIWGPWKDGAF